MRVTRRLTESPACLVADEHDVGGNLERMLKAAGQKAPDVKPILEINPQHPLVQRLEAEPDAAFDDWAACCSTRRCSPKAASSRIRPRS